MTLKGWEVVWCISTVGGYLQTSYHHHMIKIMQGMLFAATIKGMFLPIGCHDVKFD
jgi:hypothetical protein